MLLGRPIMADDSDWMAIQSNIKKTRARFAQIEPLLMRDGATMRISAYFYKATCQAILLYGCETWTLSQSKMEHLIRFHNKMVRRLAKQNIRLDPNTQQWIYPAVAPLLNLLRMYPIETYINKRKQYLLKYFIESSPSLDDVLTTMNTTTSRKDYWWNTTLQV